LGSDTPFLVNRIFKNSHRINNKRSDVFSAKSVWIVTTVKQFLLPKT